MRVEEQLKLWREGDPQHNKDRDECCPDFSCCRPELLAPEEERIMFCDRPELRGKMLGIFLCRAFENKKVHIAGTTEGVS